MFKKDSIVLLLIAIFAVGPAVLALSAYVLTKNPSLRPLGITVEQLSEAGQLADKSLITAVVDIGGNAKSTLSKSDIEKSLKTTFERRNTEVRVRFRKVSGRSDIRITYIVGESVIGPFDAARAAQGIGAATDAERLLTAQRRAAAKEAERREAMQKTGFWGRFFE